MNRSVAVVVRLFAAAMILGSTSAFALTAEQEAKLLASDGASPDAFGYSVTLDGDTAVIGAMSNDDNGADAGSAYVFTRTAGVWTEQAKLLASDGTHNDYFGWSVSVDGDTAIIGAPLDDDNGTDSGSAYVFIRTGSVWSEQAKLLATDGAADDWFGRSVTLDGDTAIIGAFADDDNGSASGSAYVFTHTAGVWTQQAKLLASDGTQNDYFGWSVAVDGDIAVVGAWSDDDNGIVPGSAYVFTRTAGVWGEQAKLLASDAAHDDYFGWSVSVDGDTAVIGAMSNDDNGTHSGSAYVFIRTGSAWTEQAKLLASDGADDEWLGQSVTLDGHIAIIGAHGDDDNGTDSGSAYVFIRTGSVWSEQAKVLASDGTYEDYFGWSVAVDGDTAVIGAYQDDNNGSGSAYVFRLYDDDVPATDVIGLGALLVAVLGSGVYLLRRRSTN